MDNQGSAELIVLNVSFGFGTEAGLILGLLTGTFSASRFSPRRAPEITGFLDVFIDSTVEIGCPRRLVAHSNREVPLP